MTSGDGSPVTASKRVFDRCKSLAPLFSALGQEQPLVFGGLDSLPTLPMRPYFIREDTLIQRPLYRHCQAP